MVVESFNFLKIGGVKTIQNYESTLEILGYGGG